MEPRFETLFVRFELKKSPPFWWAFLCFVESEGFEPSSSKGNNRPSTCLVIRLISQDSRWITTYWTCQPLEFRTGLVASSALVLKVDTPKSGLQDRNLEGCGRGRLWPQPWLIYTVKYRLCCHGVIRFAKCVLELLIKALIPCACMQAYHLHFLSIPVDPSVFILAVCQNGLQR